MTALINHIAPSLLRLFSNFEICSQKFTFKTFLKMLISTNLSLEILLFSKSIFSTMRQKKSESDQSEKEKRERERRKVKKQRLRGGYLAFRKTAQFTFYCTLTFWFLVSMHFQPRVQRAAQQELARPGRLCFEGARWGKGKGEKFEEEETEIRNRRKGEREKGGLLVAIRRVLKKTIFQCTVLFRFPIFFPGLACSSSQLARPEHLLRRRRPFLNSRLSPCFQCMTFDL